MRVRGTDWGKGVNINEVGGVMRVQGDGRGAVGMGEKEVNRS
jgi:hypothetical protein